MKVFEAEVDVELELLLVILHISNSKVRILQTEVQRSPVVWWSFPSHHMIFIDGINLTLSLA